MPARPAAARVQAFSTLRLAMAGLAIVALPVALITIKEPPTALAAFLLALLLPAAIALDTNRPARLDKALVTSVGVVAIIMIGGVLRGIDPFSAAAFMASIGMETALLGSTQLSRRTITWSIPAALLAAGALWLARASSAPFTEAAPQLSQAMLCMAFGHLMLLAVIMRSQSTTSNSSKPSQSKTNNRAEITVDAHGQVREWSEATAPVLGYSPALLEGRGLIDMILVADRPLFMLEISQAMASAEPRRIRLRLRVTPDSVAQGYRWVGLTLAQSAMKPDSLCVLFWRIEDDMAREQHLTGAPITDETATALRASFISRINHELRTPLNAVIGFSDIMMRGEFPAEQMKDFAREINEAGQDLLRTASLMIDVTRMEKGVFQLDESEQDMAKLLETALRGQDDAGELEFVLPDTATLVKLDARIVRTALQQILSLTRFDASDSRKRRVSLRVTGEHVDIGLGRMGDPDPLNLSNLDAMTAFSEAPSACRLGLAMAQGVASLHDSSLMLATSQAGNLQMRWRFQRADAASDILPNQIAA